MSIRVDTASWLAGAILVGNAGFGVLGSAIASTGTAGPGYAYNDLSLPADAGKEICGRITSWPTSGTLQAFEDTSFIYSRTGDGADSFAYQLYVDGVAVGSPQTVSLAVGTVGAVINLTGAATSQTATSSTVAVGVVPPVAGTVDLTAAPCTQSAASGTGSVNVSPFVPGIVNLAGSTCSQTSTCTVAAVSVGQYARAPAGGGYTPRAGYGQVRPADIQGYRQ